MHSGHLPHAPLRLCWMRPSGKLLRSPRGRQAPLAQRKPGGCKSAWAHCENDMRRLTVTQLAMELSTAAGKYPRATMIRRWTEYGPIAKQWWRRVAKRAIALERKP